MRRCFRSGARPSWCWWARWATSRPARTGWWWRGPRCACTRPSTTGLSTAITPASSRARSSGCWATPASSIPWYDRGMGKAARGFTLVELMIVVAILSVVAALAVTSYSRYMRHSARSEVFAMLGEIRIKELAYSAGYSTFVTATHTLNGTSETEVHPALLGPSEFKLKSWGTPADTRWGTTGLNVQTPRAQLYCGYVVISGVAGSAAPGSGTAGASILSTVISGGTIAVPWFYARGC